MAKGDFKGLRVNLWVNEEDKENMKDVRDGSGMHWFMDGWYDYEEKGRGV